MELRPTSMRLPDPTTRLLDAWAAHLTVRRGRNLGRADVLDSLLRRATPPDDLTPEARTLRELYAEIYDEEVSTDRGTAERSARRGSGDHADATRPRRTGRPAGRPARAGAQRAQRGTGQATDLSCARSTDGRHVYMGNGVCKHCGAKRR